MLFRSQMPQSSPRPRIAIVVDDESLLSALAFSLEAEGYETAAFRTPSELLQRPPPLDCLLIDHRFAEMDALEAIAAARQRGVNAPAVIIAGKPTPRFRKRAAAAAVGIVDKPLVGDELLGRIRAVLAGDQNPDSARP